MDLQGGRRPRVGGLPPKQGGAPPLGFPPNPRRMGPREGGAPSIPGAGSLPLVAHEALREGWPLKVDPRCLSGGPDTIPICPRDFPVSVQQLPIYKSLPPDHSGTSRDVRDLIRDSEQPSVCCILISLTTLASPNLKCVDPTGSGDMQT